MPDNENSKLTSITSSAVEVDEDTFKNALRLGGKPICPDQFKDNLDGKNYIQVLEYNGRTYMTNTPRTIPDFLINFQ